MGSKLDQSIYLNFKNNLYMFRTDERECGIERSTVT